MGENGAVDTANINTDAINGRTLETEVVCGSGDPADCGIDSDGNLEAKTHIKPGSIGNADLDEGAVRGGQDSVTPNNNIVDDSITTHDLAEVSDTDVGDDGAVNEVNINNDAISARTIQTGAVTTEKIRNGAVGRQNLAHGAVCGSADPADCGGLDPSGLPVPRTHIKARSIGTGDLANFDTNTQTGGAVNEVNIINLAVSERTIQDEAVTTRTIRNRHVTTEKLAVYNEETGTGGAVNNNNINTHAISTRTIEDRAVTGRKIADGAIDVVGSAGAEQRTGVHQAIIRAGSIGLDDFGDEVNNVFRRLEGDIDRLDEGIAMSHAISMIKVPEGKEFGISFAGGFYQDKQAAAIGVGFRPTDGLLLSAGASYGFDSEEVGGAVSINFGF